MSRRQAACPSDLGDLIVFLLAGTLAGLRDRLFEDGFLSAGELVGDLTDVADLYLTGPTAIEGIDPS